MTGHINVMLCLQSCADPLRVLPGSSSETFTSSSDCAYAYGNAKVEEDVDVKEESFRSINEEVDINIKEEEIPEDIKFPDTNAEPDEVSYVCVCLLLDTIYQCPEMSVVFVTSVVLATVGNEKVLLSFLFVMWRGCGSVCARWVGLSLIAEKTKIYSHLHVVKNRPQNDSCRPDNFKF